MPLLASLCSLGLWGELSNFRGPGFYFSIVKLAITIVLYVLWIRLVSWVNRDADKANLEQERWNPLLLGGGLLGLFLLWALPIFFLGLLAFVCCVAGAALAYVHTRNQHVPAAQQVLTADHLRQLAQRFLNVKAEAT